MASIDFDFLREIADNDPSYMYDVLEIFLGSTPGGMANLSQLIHESEDWEGIQRQAHTLKSSLGIIKIENLHADLAQIEHLAIKKTDKETIISVFDNAYRQFNEAIPQLEEAKETFGAQRS
jgi:HPt (histidine-containing phosphotransfer) domain-containing protein